MISVLSQLKNILSLPELLPLVSININALPVGGRLVAPDSPVGLFDLVDFIKSVILD